MRSTIAYLLVFVGICLMIYGLVLPSEIDDFPVNYGSAIGTVFSKTRPPVVQDAENFRSYHVTYYYKVGPTYYAGSARLQNFQDWQIIRERGPILIDYRLDQPGISRPRFNQAGKGIRIVVVALALLIVFIGLIVRSRQNQSQI
ncbi:MAG: hypothetical protein ABJN26_09690 [Stappiaceae bacterium]